MSIITVNPDLCRKDGICSRVCPTRLIVGEVGGLPTEREGGSCIQCGQCMAFCPHGAIRVQGLNPALARPINRKRLPEATDVDILLQSRRSIRQYKQAPVPKDVLEGLLHTAAYAPTAKNSRRLRQVVVYDAAKMKALGDCIADCLANDKSDTPLIAEGRALALAWRKGLDLILRGAPHLVMVLAPNDHWAVIDGAIYLTYLEIAGHAHGVGACWAGYVTTVANHYPAVAALLGAKEGEIVAGGQMMGLPSLLPMNNAPRAPYPATWL